MDNDYIGIMARLYDKEKRQTDQLCRPGPHTIKNIFKFKKKY